MIDPHPAPAGPDRGPAVSGALQPIVPGFHPDPTICRVGDDYYLAHSSFEYFPGAPIFHSRDLVSWQQIGHVITRPSQFMRRTHGPSRGVYGSTLRHHDGVFRFITTNASDFDSGQLVFTASDPAGEWSEPVSVPRAIGIDPDLCWDDDGTCYLTWHALDFVEGGKGILQAPIDLATGELLEDPYPVWQGSGLPAAEGPHLHRIGDFWYIVLAEGGTERGHCVTVARSSSVRGPFEPSPENPILTRRSSIHPVQNVGHADLVETVDGEWAAVYLGVRPRGSTPGYHVLGRETFLAGVAWKDGWPIVVDDAFEVPPMATGFVEDFSTRILPPRWITPRGEPAATGAGVQGRGWVLDPSAPGPLCVRVLDLAWSAVGQFSGAGRMTVRIDDRHWCGIQWDGERARVLVHIGDVLTEVASMPLSDASARLVLSSVPSASPQIPLGHGGPDDLVASIGTAEGTIELARLDGRYFSTEVASGFTGRVLAFEAGGPGSVLQQVSYEPA
ncbi:glycoside hydrolase family 43 protein [Rathayibacter sp. VKM Ac-2760]|uniref:glycoside hydrolase family 43 protein n=1 Tax=Rathayibacter sp. VKM Ac-2760 TaxID=2609253 RepID=UPI0013185446|nr:glycoside hydrolase family 43 protein [Rathayibacter sp. VKM Ac-2760]QHC61095.1 family 43 glycosylhydrolase [Rathayibacter sp. VKM Ac-2760]